MQADAAREARANVWDDAPCGLIQLDARLRIVGANARFLELTGHSAADLDAGLRLMDVLAPAARILFEAQLAPLLALNGAIDEVLVELVRADGRRLPVLLNARTPAGGDGPTTMAVLPVPDRARYEEQLRVARKAAEEANAANAAARRRLALLARANEALASTLDVAAALTGLAQVLVEGWADWCLVLPVAAAGAGTPPPWAAAHVDAARLPALHRLAALLPDGVQPGSALSRVRSGEGPVLVTDLAPDVLRRAARTPAVAELLVDLAPGSVIVAPTTAHGRIVAVLTLGRGADAAPFTAADLDDIVDFAAQTGIAIDNLRLHAREHSASVALQQALMTSPPVHAGLDIVSRYVAGESSQEVGGDWYDSFTESDGTAVAVIGDVVGHDIAAAALMGQLRGIIRTIGFLQPGSPAGVLGAADRAAAGLGVRVLASALVARFVETPDGPTSHAIEWSSAGHPPPLLVRAGGTVEVFAERNDLLLGIDPRVTRHDHTVAIGPGDTVVLYTDGLIERPDRDLDDGIAQLAAALQAAAGAPLDDLCTAALGARDERTTDDVALLALRVRSD